jgi:YVTN family beta-propeller protein
VRLHNKVPLAHVSQCLIVGLFLAWPTATWAQAIVATLPVAGRAVAVNSVTNRIYVTYCASLRSAADGLVVVIDGATNSTSEITVGLCPTAIAVNPATNKIYVANIGDTPGFGYFGGGSITVIDGTTNSAVAINDPHAPCAVAVNPTTNKIYVANRNSNDVTVIDGVTNSVTTAADPHAMSPVAVAVNPVTNKIYVANRGNGSSNLGNVTVIDGASNSTITITDPNAVSPNAVAVNTATNRIYVTNGGAYPATNHGNVTVIDGATKSTTTVTDPNALAPQAIAVNSTTNKIYVANANNAVVNWTGVVTVIDGATNSVTTVTDPNAEAPGAVAVNEATNMVYVANGGCGPGPGNGCGNPGANPGSITIIGGATNSVATIIDPSANSPEAVALDPVTNQIYVANTGSGNLTVIDGAGTATMHTLAVLLPGSGSGTVASTPSGINCGTSSCAARFAVGTPVSLSASAASGSNFVGWSGPCSGAGACDVVANEDQFVTATFNSPPMQVAVPNVVGQTQAAATTSITGAGLIVGTVSEQSSGTIASGDVISESPAADTNVASGSAVNLVVSTGSSSGGSGSGGGYGGSGGIDALTLGALLGPLLLALWRSGVSARLRRHGRY